MKDKKEKKKETIEDLSKNVEVSDFVEAKHTSKIGVVDVPILEEVAVYRKVMSNKERIMGYKIKA